MKRQLLILSAIAIGVTGAGAWVSTSRAKQAAEVAAVRAALDHYLQGHATGDGAHMRIAFHPDAKLFFIRDGQFSSRTSAEYIAGFTGKPAADEAQRKRRIEDVDVTGTAASGKIVLDYPNATLTDYMSLLKVNGEWKIVNKIFHSQPKSR